MILKAYNGYGGAQRDKAQRWLRAQWASGQLARPSKCCACGQDQGIIDAHAESYSEPFAAGKTDEFHLCFTCHMIVHCRFRSRPAWNRYCAAIAAGGHFGAVLKRDFATFSAEHLDGPVGYARALKRFKPGAAPARRVLEEIDAR